MSIQVPTLRLLAWAATVRMTWLPVPSRLGSGTRKLLAVIRATVAANEPAARERRGRESMSPIALAPPRVVAGNGAESRLAPRPPPPPLVEICEHAIPPQGGCPPARA